MTTPVDEDATSSGDQEFTLVRVVSASTETVWQLWTDPAELTHWFHPQGATTPRDTISVDLRVGGRYRYTMVDDRSGAETVAGGIYLDVREPERLVFTWGGPDDPVEGAPIVTVTLTARGDQTEIVLHVRRIASRRHGDTAVDGWDQALDILAAHLDAPKEHHQ